MLAKLRLGCLPVRLETGRYSIPRLTEEERVCLVCRDSLVDVQQDPEGPAGAGPVESEVHFLFDCEPYRHERLTWMQKMTLPPNFLQLDLTAKLKLVLNDTSHVKPTAQFITNAFEIRRKILN